MSIWSHYPPDIRNFDNDPRSPFYQDPQEGFVDAFVDEIKAADDTLHEVLQEDDKFYEFIFGLAASVTLDENDTPTDLKAAIQEKAEEAITRHAEYLTAQGHTPVAFEPDWDYADDNKRY